MEITRDILLQYQDEGKIRIVSHPIWQNLWKVNYTDNVMRGYLWDNVTMQCRGHVYDTFADGSVKLVARPFEKFFNLNENEWTKEELYNWSTARVVRKYDGVLIVAFSFRGRVVFGTRGSFDNTEFTDVNFTREAGRIASEKDYTEHIRDAPEGYTFMFELVTPKHRIVEKYEEEDLILLGIRPGINMPVLYDFPPGGFYHTNFNIAENYGFQTLDFLKVEKTSDNMEEGYVVYVHKHGELLPSMVKIKRDKYIQIHKVIMGVGYKLYYELVRDGGFGKLTDWLHSLPEEIKPDVREDLHDVYAEVCKIEDFIDEFLEENEISTPKDLGLLVQKHPLKSLMFMKYHKKDNFMSKLWQHVLFNKWKSK